MEQTIRFLPAASRALVEMGLQGLQGRVTVYAPLNTTARKVQNTTILVTATN